MRWSTVVAIVRRELRDILRDRRTLITSFVMPVLIYPLLTIGMGALTKSERDKVDAAEIPLMIREGGNPVASRPAVPEASTPSFLACLLLDSRVRIERPEFPDKALEDGKILGVINIPGDISARVERREQTIIDVRLYSAHPLSEEVRGVVNKALARYSSGLVPLSADVEDLSPPSHRGAAILGGMLGFILISLAVSAALMPAVDLVAGEKERGTLEALLISPASRVEIVIGKFLTVLIIGTASTAVSLGSLAVSMNSMLSSMKAAGKIEISVGPGAFATIFLALVLVTALFASLGLAVSAFARSFKEAQSWMAPLMFLVIPLGMMATPPTTMLSSFAWVPITNVALLVKDMMRDQAAAGDVLIVIGIMSALVFVALSFTVSLFQREDVIFREGGVPLFRRDPRRFAPPTPAAIIAVLACVVSTFSLASVLQGAHSATQLLVQQSTFFIAALVAWIATVGPLRGLVGRIPTRAQALGGVLAGLGSFLAVVQLHALRSLIFPGPATYEADLQKAVGPILELGAPVAVLLIAVMPSLCEEFLFRGLVQSAFGAGNRAVSGVLVSAGMFALIHFVPAQMLTAALLGIILGVLRLRTGGVMAGMLTHAVNNGMVAAVALGGSFLLPFAGEGAIPGLSATATRVVCLAGSAALFIAAERLTRARVAPSASDG